LQSEFGAKCDVCLYETEEENDMVFCDFCKVGVHLECYWRDLIEEVQDDK